MEVRGQTLAVHEGQLLLDVVNARVNGRTWHREQEEVEDLKSDRLDKFVLLLTRLRNSEKLLLTMALTTLPLTSASQMLIRVRATSKIVRR